MNEHPKTKKLTFGIEKFIKQYTIKQDTIEDKKILYNINKGYDHYNQHLFERFGYILTLEEYKKNFVIKLENRKIVKEFRIKYPDNCIECYSHFKGYTYPVTIYKSNKNSTANFNKIRSNLISKINNRIMENKQEELLPGIANALLAIEIKGFWHQINVPKEKLKEMVLYASELAEGSEVPQLDISKEPLPIITQDKTILDKK